MKKYLIILVIVLSACNLYASPKADCKKSGGVWGWANNSWICTKNGKHKIAISISKPKSNSTYYSPKKDCLKSGGEWLWTNNSWVCKKGEKYNAMINTKVSLDECIDYMSKYNHFTEVFSSAKYDKKKWSLILVKSYMDSLILTCNGVVDISFYQKQVKNVKKMWYKYIPENIRKENVWIY